MLDGAQAHSPKRDGAPNFRPTSIVDKRLHGSRCHLVRRYRPRPTRHCVRWAPSSPSPKGAQLPNFRPNSAVAKRPDRLRLGATWYGLPRGPGDCVRWGPSYPRKRAHPPHPIFGPCLLWPNGWMDEDATWYGSTPQLRPRYVLDGVPALSERGTAVPSSFRPMSIVATVAHLSYC